MSVGDRERATARLRATLTAPRPLLPADMPCHCHCVSVRVQQTSRAVIWDRIIQDEKDALIQQTIDNEYTINDQNGQLRGRNMKLTLHYDVMPIVGMLRIGMSPLTCTAE